MSNPTRKENKMTLQLEFSTTAYEFNHGRKPKGFGRWAFIAEGIASEILAPYSMTLGDAKKWFKQYLRDQKVEGYFVVKVCP